VVIRRKRELAHQSARVTSPARQARFGRRRYWRPAPRLAAGLLLPQPEQPNRRRKPVALWAGRDARGVVQANALNVLAFSRRRCETVSASYGKERSVDRSPDNLSVGESQPTGVRKGDESRTKLARAPLIGRPPTQIVGIAQPRSRSVHDPTCAVREFGCPVAAGKLQTSIWRTRLICWRPSAARAGRQTLVCGA
jgi:hypothetical protein